MTLGFLLLGIATLLGLAGWIWLTVDAFKRRDNLAGGLLLASFLLPIGPFVALWLFFTKWPEVQRPARLVIVSGIMAFLAGLMIARGAKQAAEEFASMQPTFEITQGETSDGALSGAPSSSDRADNPPPPPPPPPQRPPPRPAAPPRPVSPVSEPIDREARAPQVSAQERPPVTVEFISIGASASHGLRPLTVRVRNVSTNAVREMKVSLEYRDERGRRLGQWTTVHAPDQIITPAASTNDTTLQAFFVPTFTKDARVQLVDVLFDGGRRWPE